MQYMTIRVCAKASIGLNTQIGVNMLRFMQRTSAKSFRKRVRKTVPQKELGTQERQNNLKKAFNISADVVKLNKTIVIDDIYTTGSTLDAVALELKRHGVRTIYFITLCIGDGI